MKMKNNVKEHNNEIIDELRTMLDETYVQRIIACLEETGADGELEIVEKPNVDKRYDDLNMSYWDSFDHVLVDQFGGEPKNGYTGYVYIPIGEGQYLKSHYVM